MDNNNVENSSTKKTTQLAEVLKYMQTHDHITQAIAIERFGAYRLSDIIYRLRHRGYEITSRSVTKKNRYGSYSTYSEYVLAK